MTKYVDTACDDLPLVDGIQFTVTNADEIRARLPEGWTFDVMHGNQSDRMYITGPNRFLPLETEVGNVVIFHDGPLPWCGPVSSKTHPLVPNGELDFGVAIRALKQGRRVARAGWNGKGMYLWLLPAASVKAEWCKEPHLKALAEANGGEIEALGSIRMFTTNVHGRRAVLTGWLASQTDMLSSDWTILP